MSIKIGKSSKASSSIIFGFMAFVFLLLGIMFAIVGKTTNDHTKEFAKTAKETTATITDIKTSTKTTRSHSKHGSKTKTTTTHDVYVSYTIDGIEYNDIKINNYNSSYKEGKEITLYYNPNDPTDTLTSLETTYVPIIISVILLILGSVFLISAIISTYKKRTHSY